MVGEVDAEPEAAGDCWAAAPGRESGRRGAGKPVGGSWSTLRIASRCLDSSATSPSRHCSIERFRHREWTPALRAAGVEHRRLYDCRHTFATWAIEDTYFRWMRRTGDQLRAVYDANDLAAAGTL